MNIGFWFMYFTWAHMHLTDTMRHPNPTRKKYVLSFFKAKPSRGNGLVNTVSDYLGPGVGSTPFLVSHRALGILHQIRPIIWPFWNGRSWLQNATASSHRAWHDLCQRHVQGETGQCQDGSTQLQDTMALTHHALPLHPSWPQLQPANERCADGLLALHQTTVSHPLGSSILAPASSSIWTTSKWLVCTSIKQQRNSFAIAVFSPKQGRHRHVPSTIYLCTCFKQEPNGLTMSGLRCTVQRCLAIFPRDIWIPGAPKKMFKRNQIVAFRSRQHLFVFFSIRGAKLQLD